MRHSNPPWNGRSRMQMKEGLAAFAAQQGWKEPTSEEESRSSFMIFDGAAVQKGVDQMYAIAASGWDAICGGPIVDVKAEAFKAGMRMHHLFSFCGKRNEVDPGPNADRIVTNRTLSMLGKLCLDDQGRFSMENIEKGSPLEKILIENDASGKVGNNPTSAYRQWRLPKAQRYGTPAGEILMGVIPPHVLAVLYALHRYGCTGSGKDEKWPALDPASFPTEHPMAVIRTVPEVLKEAFLTESHLMQMVLFYGMEETGAIQSLQTMEHFKEFAKGKTGPAKKFFEAVRERQEEIAEDIVLVENLFSIWEERFKRRQIDAANRAATAEAAGNGKPVLDAKLVENLIARGLIDPKSERTGVEISFPYPAEGTRGSFEPITISGAEQGKQFQFSEKLVENDPVFAILGEIKQPFDPEDNLVVMQDVATMEYHGIPLSALAELGEAGCIRDASEEMELLNEATKDAAPAETTAKTPPEEGFEAAEEGVEQEAATT